jgi:hypothetical protein
MGVLTMTRNTLLAALVVALTYIVGGCDATTPFEQSTTATHARTAALTEARSDGRAVRTAADVCTTEADPWTEERDREIAARTAGSDPTFRADDSARAHREGVPPLAYDLTGFRLPAGAPPAPSARDDLAEEKGEEMRAAFEAGDRDMVRALVEEGNRHEAH